MHISENVAENLRFLCVEVDSQLLNLQRYMRAPADSLMARIVDRGGYTSNLKTRIHKDRKSVV